MKLLALALDLTLAWAVVLVAACEPPQPSSRDGGASPAPEAEPEDVKAEAKPEPELAPEAGAEGASAERPLERYSVESGIVHYELGGGQSGTEVLYFVDYGAREARYTHVSLDGSAWTDRLTLLDGPTQHTIDMQTMLGTTVGDVYVMFGGIENHRARGEKAGLANLAEVTLAAMRAKKTGTRIVAGVECDEWVQSQRQNTSCVKDGVTLASSSEFGGIVHTMTATKAELGVAVPEDKLAVPKGVVLREFGRPHQSGE